VLHREQGGAAPFAARGEALEDAQQDQGGGRGGADLPIGGEQADERGRRPHEQQGQHEHALAAQPVAEPAGEDCAEGPEQEADADRGQGDQGGQSGGLLVQRGEEARREHQARGLGVDEEVVPLDGGAGERAHEGLAVVA
jgi:hypothetical protein